VIVPYEIRIVQTDIERAKHRPFIRNTRAAAKVVRKIANLPQEQMAVISLEGNMRLINIRIVSVGNSNDSVVSFRDILRGPIVDQAYSFIAVHNHPNSTVKFSKLDRRLFKELRKAAGYVDIVLMDFVVVHGKKFRSIFEDENYAGY